MNTRKGMMLLAGLALSLAGLAQASCEGGENLATVAATPSEGFFDLGDGLVRHRPTQLMWTRCPLGQSWTGSSCTGEASLLDWGSALWAAANHEQAGFSDWRLPNRNELASIVETRCHSPAINGEIFPGSPAGVFLSSSPGQGEAEGAQVWVVDFADGAVNVRPVGELHRVRLVRGGRL